MKSRATIVRQGIAVLLIWAAYWAALPWIDCMRAFMPFGFQNAFDLGLGGCTFGFPYTGPRTPGALYPDLIVAALYVVAGLWAAFSRPVRLRPLLARAADREFVAVPRVVTIGVGSQSRDQVPAPQVRKVSLDQFFGSELVSEITSHQSGNAHCR